MKSFSPYKIPALALVLYFILYVLFYDKLQYLLDSDAVAYLTIASRVAEGDYFRSINGLWSPLNSWLLVPFINNGVDAWTAAKGLNAFFGGVLILQFWYLLKLLNFSKKNINIGTLVVVIPVCFFVYFQMFGDVLQLIFALGYVQLFVCKDFVLKVKLVLIAALIMGIGYYAKAYSLVFFLLHFSVLVFIAYRKNKEAKRIILGNYLAGIVLILLLVLPWAFQLQKKYGEFALTGMAGKLNMSWYINSGKTFKDDIGLLIPPAYDDSPSFWEDPYLSAGELSTPFTSVHHFKHWVLRVGHTCLMAAKSACKISLFFIPIFLIFSYRLFKKKKVLEPFKKIFWAVVILPLGYLTMHIETRYIWLTMFLIIILGFDFLQEWKFLKFKKKVSIIVFCFSIVIFPLIMLLTLKDKNKELFELAKELKGLNTKGKIVTNKKDEGSFWVTSYLAGMKNYTIEQSNYSLEELMREMNRYQIKQYVHFIEEGGDYNINNTSFQNNFEMVAHIQKGVILYKLKN